MIFQLLGVFGLAALNGLAPINQNNRIYVSEEVSAGDGATNIYNLNFSGLSDLIDYSYDGTSYHNQNTYGVSYVYVFSDGTIEIQKKYSNSSSIFSGIQYGLDILQKLDDSGNNYLTYAVVVRYNLSNSYNSLSGGLYELSSSELREITFQYVYSNPSLFRNKLTNAYTDFTNNLHYTYPVMSIGLTSYWTVGYQNQTNFANQTYYVTGNNQLGNWSIFDENGDYGGDYYDSSFFYLDFSQYSFGYHLNNRNNDEYFLWLDEEATSLYSSYSFKLTTSTIPLVTDDINQYTEGFNYGYGVGYGEGYDDGVIDGRIEGSEYGKEVGREEGRQVGYAEGIEYAQSQNSIALTIFTGIINIALIPINFFLACLNFEVFGINIGGAVSALLTVCIIIIVVRMITGKKTNGE